MNHPTEGRPGRIGYLARFMAALLMPAAIVAALSLNAPATRRNDLLDRFDSTARAAAERTPRLPERIDECETYTVEVCGSWALQPEGFYRATWNDGATGTVRVIDYSGTTFEATRVDDVGRGRTARYSGLVTEGKLVHSGSVRWTTGDESHAGTWHATWEPRHRTGEDEFDRNTLPFYQQRSDGGSHWAILDGTLVATGPAMQSVLLRNDAAFADGWVETVSSRADDGGLVLRARENGDYYLLAFRDDGAPDPRGALNLALYHHVGPEYREMWNLDVPWLRGSRHTIRFEAVGDRLRVYWDGERRADILAGKRLNEPAPYSGPGRAGLRHYGADARWITSFDVFRWGEAPR